MPNIYEIISGNPIYPPELKGIDLHESLRALVDKHPTMFLSSPNYLGIYQKHTLNPGSIQSISESVMAQTLFVLNAINQGRKVKYYFENGEHTSPKDHKRDSEFIANAPLEKIFERIGQNRQGSSYFKGILQSAYGLRQAYPDKVFFELEKAPKINPNKVFIFADLIVQPQPDTHELFIASVDFLGHVIMRDFRLAGQIHEAFGQGISAITNRGTMHLGLVHSLHLFAPEITSGIDINRPIPLSGRNRRQLSLFQLLWNQKLWQEIYQDSKINPIKARTAKIEDVGRSVKRLFLRGKNQWQDYLWQTVTQELISKENSLGILTQDLKDPLQKL